MQKLLLLLFLLSSQSLFGQANKNVSVFHRLLINNSDNELLVVRFKDTNIWVTPGFYQDSTQLIKQGLNKVAADYGISISSPELKGIFVLRTENNDQTSVSIRNMYTCNYLNGELKTPDFLGEVKWLPIDEAMKIIPFPHINLLIKQTYDFPNTVWGGAIARYKENDEWKIKILEDFYPLFSLNKKKRRKRRQQKH